MPAEGKHKEGTNNMRNPEKEWRRTSIDQFLSSDPKIRERTEEKK